MLSAASTLLSRLVLTQADSRRDFATLLVIAALNVAALIIMAMTELDPATKVTFLLTWGLLNCSWLVALRRPAIAALLSLAMVVALILLSQFKYDKLWMTANFVDMLAIDQDTAAFVLTAMPRLRWQFLIGAAIGI